MFTAQKCATIVGGIMLSISCVLATAAPSVAKDSTNPLSNVSLFRLLSGEPMPQPSNSSSSGARGASSGSVSQPTKARDQGHLQQIYSISMVTICTILPMILIAILLFAPELLYLPRGNEFNHFLQDMGNKRNSPTSRSSSTATPAGARKVVPPGGKLSLKPNRQARWKR